MDEKDFLVTLQKGNGQEVFWEQEFKHVRYEELVALIFSDGLEEKDWGLAMIWEKDNWGGYDIDAAHIFKGPDGIYAS